MKNINNIKNIPQKQSTNNSNIFAILAIITAIIPIIIWLVIITSSIGEHSNSETFFSGTGFVATMFYWTYIGYILPILTIIFAIIGLKKSTLKKTSIISLCLVGVHAALYFGWVPLLNLILGS